MFAQAYSRLEKKLIRSIYKESGLRVDKVPNLAILYARDGQEGQIQLDFHPGDSTVLDLDKLVSIGDLSQFWTAQQIMALVKDGQIKLSDDINSYLPSNYQNPTTTSIESLLIHYSGLPKIPTNFGAYEKDPVHPYRFYPDTALLEFFHSFSLLQAGQYKYSTVDYALLQYLLAQKGIHPPKAQGKSNQGYKEGHPIAPISYYQFTCAKGLQMTPNQLFNYLQAQKDETGSYPIFATGLQKNTYSSYGFHVTKFHKNEVAILKSATNGFTLLAAFDRHKNRTLLIIADAQDYTGYLFAATSWFFR